MTRCASIVSTLLLVSTVSGTRAKVTTEFVGVVLLTLARGEVDAEVAAISKIESGVDGVSGVSSGKGWLVGVVGGKGWSRESTVGASDIGKVDITSARVASAAESLERSKAGGATGMSRMMASTTDSGESTASSGSLVTSSTSR